MRYLTALMVLMLCNGTALAQPRLESSQPARNATVPPTGRIDLKFSEKFENAMVSGSVVEMDVPNGGSHQLRTMTMIGEDRRTMILSVGKPLHEGRYMVRYRVISAGRDVVAGGFAFRVRAGKDRRQSQ